jgi:succinyl-diaminopimelate desuccinylase
MTGAEGAVIDALQAAREDYDAVVKLTRELVRIPSRGGIDSYDPVLERMAAWLGEHGLACRRLAGPGGTTVALTCEVGGGRPPGLGGDHGRVAAWPRIIGFQGRSRDLRPRRRPAP